MVFFGLLLYVLAMCGITAVLVFTGRSKPQGSEDSTTVNSTSRAKSANGEIAEDAGCSQFDVEQLAKSLELLTHRGPDHRGTWVSKDGLIGPLNGQLSHRVIIWILTIVKVSATLDLR